MYECCDEMKSMESIKSHSTATIQIKENFGYSNILNVQVVPSTTLSTATNQRITRTRGKIDKESCSSRKTTSYNIDRQRSTQNRAHIRARAHTHSLVEPLLNEIHIELMYSVDKEK